MKCKVSAVCFTKTDILARATDVMFNVELKHTDSIGDIKTIIFSKLKDIARATFDDNLDYKEVVVEKDVMVECDSIEYSLSVCNENIILRR